MTPLSGSSVCPSCGAQPGSEPDNPLYLPAGCLLNNRYLIGKVIGVGGFGIVYLAWDNNLDIKVAIKEYLPKEYAARASDHLSLTPYTGNARDEYGFGMEKFLDEAKALAKFQDHVGIVTVYESFRANNTAYMVMQYLDGITLKEFLKKQPDERISFDLAVKALTPIMDALREVHNAGYVHRDISPDNIFLTRQKQVKLLDFGAARYAIGEHSKSLTTVLKHGYAPVEQYSTKGNQGPWTDVYAVAATLYRCVTGQVPPDAMERMQEECIVSPKQLGTDIPLQGELALMKGLALKAVDRFENVRDLQSALVGDSLDLPANPAPDVIQPRRPGEVKIVECPECGTKNQLQPGDDQNALRCGKCRRELGSKPVDSGLPRFQKQTEFRDYGADASDARLTSIKIGAGVFVTVIIAIVFMSGDKTKTSTKTRSSQNAVYAPQPVRQVPQYKPSPRQEPTPQPVYQPPTPVQVTRSEPDIGQYIFVAKSADGEKFYYDSSTFRRFENGNIDAVLYILNRYGSAVRSHNISVDCNSALFSVNNGRYSQIQQNSVGEKLYENFCNR
jgi:serine/threonine protein kinase